MLFSMADAVGCMLEPDPTSLIAGRSLSLRGVGEEEGTHIPVTPARPVDRILTAGGGADVGVKHPLADECDNIRTAGGGTAGEAPLLGEIGVADLQGVAGLPGVDVTDSGAAWTGTRGRLAACNDTRVRLAGRGGDTGRTGGVAAMPPPRAEPSPERGETSPDALPKRGEKRGEDESAFVGSTGTVYEGEPALVGRTGTIGLRTSVG